MTGKEFIQKALANKILVVPGSAFSQQDTHFRISFAAPDEELVKASKILCKMVENLDRSCACG